MKTIANRMKKIRKDVRKFAKEKKQLEPLLREIIELYSQHVEYLCRAIKTAEKMNEIELISKFKQKIEDWQGGAKPLCHEVAINRFFGTNFETHQNSKGKEAEYTSLPQAKFVSRTHRVKYLWARVYEEIDRDPQLNSFECYDLVATRSGIIMGGDGQTSITQYRCPYCNELIAKLTTRDNGYGDIDYDIEHFDECEHFFYCDRAREFADEFDTELPYELLQLLRDSDLANSVLDSLYEIERNKDLDSIEYECIESPYSSQYDEFVFIFIKDNKKELKRKLLEYAKSILSEFASSRL